MKKLFLAFALVACFAVSALSQGAPPWTIQEVDGSPRVNSPTLIKVTNGTLSCTGKTCTITISGGGGGSPGGSSTQVQYNAAGSFGGISGFTSDGTNVTAGSGNLRATRPRFITSIDDTNGNEVFVITATGSAVNEVTIANAATGNNPTFTASGGDANVGINFVPKGSGTIQVSGAAIVTVSATQTLTNKTLSTSNTVSAALTWTAGVKQTFAPDATTAGINVGSVAGDPSVPANGDLWYDSTANELTARINGANVALGSGGGGGGITIGTTTITSGTNTRVLYNNSGVVGEYTITGTGNVVMSTSPTITTGLTLSSATLTMSGNISAAAWTTNGIRYASVPGTLTDTTSSGTVATAYTNVYGGNTIAASSSTTYTDYFTTFMTQPTAGTNVTFTRRWALGLSGAISVSSTSATSLVVGANGVTNPSFTVDNSVASQATGITVTGRADGTAPTVTVNSRTQITTALAGNGLVITADPAIAGSSVAGAAAGGAITITSGAAARLTSGNANGGNIVLTGGAGVGTGTAGQVFITQAGAVGAPSLAIGSATDGIYSVGAGVLGFVTSGTSRGGLNSNGFFISQIGIDNLSQDNWLRRGGVNILQLAGNGSGTTPATFSTPARTPAQITADQNNYAPGTGWFQRWSSDASRNITGMSQGNIDGQLMEIWNVGSNNIVLQNENASSTAANRFTTSTGADLTLTAGKCAIARYDTTSTRWRVYLCN